MARWEPGATGRLREAAMELYAERGYDRTTVAEIADRAGVTARTFFRHFADKREVLFAGSERLEQQMVKGMTEVPPDAPPLAVVTAGVLSSAAFFDDMPKEYSRRRAAVISGTPELLERELIKMASLTASLTQALRDRGVDQDVAALAAETGVAVFRVSFERWLQQPEDTAMADVMTSMFRAQAGLTA